MRRLLQLSSFHAFRFPGFSALWTGALISNVGTWMSTVALGVAVTEHTGKAAWVGMVAAMTFLPSVLLAPMAGALADRFERRKYLFVLNTVQILVAASLATLAFSGNLTVGWMSALAFVNGCANTLSNPAFVALISELVPPSGLANAFSLNSAQFNLGRIIGPALATVVFAAGGATWAFALNAVSYTGVLWALKRLPAPDPHRERNEASLLEGIREGLDVARRDPGIRLSLGATLAVAMLVAPFIGMIPVYALKVFGRGAELASLLTTSQGIGAVSVALMIGPLVSRFGFRRLAVTASLLLGPSAGLFWAAPNPALAAVLIAPLGGMYLASLTTFNTVEQLRAPRSVQARISSLHSMVLGGGYAVGLMVLGVLADAFGLRLVMALASLLFGAAVVVTRVWAPRAIEALEPLPTQAVSSMPAAAR
ncbi:MAG: MFS transporter [Myxococcaceae bacterium]